MPVPCQSEPKIVQFFVIRWQVRQQSVIVDSMNGRQVTFRGRRIGYLAPALVFERSRAVPFTHRAVLAFATVALVALTAALPVGLARESEAELRSMIGQMLLVGFNGTSPNGAGARRIANQIERGEISGVILMDRNIKSPAQVKALTAKFRATGHPLTPIISVDQEGGLVQRLSARKGFKAYPTARTVARLYKPDKAKRIYRAMAAELAEAGFNLNYGPVVDLNVNRANPVIGRLGRSYGSDPR